MLNDTCIQLQHGRVIHYAIKKLIFKFLLIINVHSKKNSNVFDFFCQFSFQSLHNSIYVGYVQFILLVFNCILFLHTIYECALKEFDLTSFVFMAQ
jgi:hypothetical protein